MMDIGNVVLVDRSTRAIAAQFEIFLDRDMALEWLELAPDVVTDDVVSWGRVTPDQINSLFDLCDDRDGAEMFAAALAKHAGSDTFISLFWHSGRALARGE